MAGSTPSFKKKPAGISYEYVVHDVQAGNLKPVYYLMGDESYYIDHIADFIVDTVLKPEERDFNLVTFFGAEAKIDDVLTTAKAYPMGASHLVVLVKEAQNLKHIDRLELYFRQMQPSTILIFCHKNGTLDRRLKVVALIQKEGVLFESKKLYDHQLPAFVANYLKRRKVAAEPGAGEMLAEFVGSDLNRLASELDKLILSLPKGGKTVTVEMVRENIGISKNFNVFEFQDALAQKNVAKANQIAKYFYSNPKENPLQMVLASVFRYFSTAMQAYYAPDKSERGIAAWLGVSDWQVRKNVMPVLRSYSGIKVMQIIAEVRRTDARSKGVDNPATSNEDLLKELVYFILH